MFSGKKSLCILMAIGFVLTSAALLASCKGGSKTPSDSNKTEPSKTTPPKTDSTPDPLPPPTGDVVYSVVPDMIWATATKDDATATFVMGNSVNAFQFAPIDVSEMKYLEFDLYLPSVKNLSKITENSQFEITSSGTCDVEEFSWSGTSNGILRGQKLEEGWNHVKVRLNSMPGVNRKAVNYIRWYWTAPASTIDGCKIANLRFTVDGSIDPPVIGKTAGTGFIVETVYPTEDVVVATVDITQAPYNADPTGKTDVTKIINKALSDVSVAGGGTVWMPAGKYLVTDTVTIPAYCTLRGDWQDPDTGTEYGTVILAKVKANQPVNHALFLIGGSAGVNGLTVYYPEQSIKDVKEYPFTFYTTGDGSSYMLASVTNCTVINGYRGIGACVVEGNAHEQFSIDNVKGTFLCTAAEVYNQADVGTWKCVNVNSKYWIESPLAETPVDADALRAYMRANTVGLILGDLEWTEFAGLYVDGCKYGIQIVKGHRIEFAGSIYDAIVTNCDIGLKVDAIDTRWGMTVTNSRIEGSVFSIQNNAGGIVKAVNVKLSGEIGGSGEVSTETAAIADQITIDYKTTYQKPAAKLYLYQGGVNGKEDLSAVIQALLNEAGKTGGIVYLPGGYYRLDAPLTVPAGVELRGAAGSPTREATGLTRGTVLLAYYGDGSSFGTDDQALITLKENAGVNGIRILYPENGPADRSLNTTYAIRGTGAGVYVVNTSISAAAYGVDFSDCDRHYIKKLVTCCYYNAIQVGGDNGTVEGCLQNGTVLLRMSGDLSAFCKNMISLNDVGNKLFDTVTRRKCKYIIVKEGDGQTIYNTFAYGTQDLVDNEGGTNVRVVSVGGDNIGRRLISQSAGSMTVLGAMRYNGTSYHHTAGTLNLYTRLTINDKHEPSLELSK
ncbi:MAG: hypothetical protein IJW98_08785 [Clostridia bacterium]|nr:hypothetical protein [Clostridia bacterium]